MRAVLDASAIIAVLRDEAGAETVARIVTESPFSCLIHVVNLAEVFYDSYRAGGEERAQTSLAQVQRLGIRKTAASADPIWRRAATLKAIHRRISLADCWAIATAEAVRATLVTADRHEMEPIQANLQCAVLFFR